MEPLPLPTSLAEVEGLIQALYQQSNPPKTINAIQEVLQRLQKSDQGWQLARSLISHSDPNIKFFAALTLIVKLNKESPNLSEDDARELLQNVIDWLLGSLVDGTPNFVVKKLCSALVTHFIYFSHVWPKCFRQLLYCMDIGRGVSVESLDDALKTPILVASLDDRKIWLAIHFALALVEEVGKTDMSSHILVHERLVKNGPDITCLLSRAFDGVLQSSYGQSLLSCYQAWILYAQRASITNQQYLVPPLRELVEPAMKCFMVESLLQEATGLFTDIFQNYSGFFTDTHYEAMFTVFESPWGTQLYEQVRNESSNAVVGAFGIMMLAYGDAKVSNLMESVDQRSQGFLSRLVGLLDADGYLVGEDTIFVPALEFWLTFAETMVDSTFSNESEVSPWRPYADGHLKNVVVNSWKKIRWPPAEVFADWDLDERTGFNDARKDVADLLQSIFTLNGVTLVSFFVDLFLQSLRNKSWPEVEASLFCLSALSDCVTDEPKYDNELGRIFSAPFFELLGETRGPIPLRLRQTGLSLVGRCCEYFERHSEYLPHALNLLFAAVGDPILGSSSARSISTLCSSCRTVLTGETEAFIRQYQTIRNGQILDSIAEEKILHAIGSIIEAIPDEELRLSMFEALYSFLKRDVERATQLKSKPGILNLADPNFSRGLDNWSSPQPVPSHDEIAQGIALRALRCLASLAKGMRDTRGKVVELELDSALVPREGRLAVIQADIMGLMAGAQQTFCTSGEVIEAICNIFRAGFSETEPGPFVFPADAVTDFYVQQSLATPRLGTLLSSVCSFVGFLLRGPRALVPGYLSRLLPWVVSILQALLEPESDTEITLNGISLVDKIMSKHPAVLFQLQPPQLLEFFFLFTLKVLNGKEPLPKCAAADFWSDFITLKSDDPSLQVTISTAMSHLGPLFTQTLIRNIGGNAARSEIDKLSDPLKKLVVQQPRAQAWLEHALSNDFPSAQVTQEEKMLFLKKILGLRGARQTNNVVRDFWLACRGSNFAYAS